LKRSKKRHRWTETVNVALLPVPATLTRRFADWEWSVAWHLVAQMQTWRLVHPDGRIQFLKLAVRDWEVDLPGEVERTRWANRVIAAPEVLDSGSDGELDWILTRGLPGENALAPELLENPGLVAGELGRALRRLHEAPTADCPFDASNAVMLAHLRARDPDENIDRVGGVRTVASALAELEELRPATEDLVLTHGDPCLPNFLFENGEVTGFIDLGALGLADRWRDLAICAWSLGFNLGPGWEDVLFEAYGVERNESRRKFYELLYWSL